MKTLGIALIIFGVLVIALPDLLRYLVALFFIGLGLSIVASSYGRKRWVIRQE